MVKRVVRCIAVFVLVFLVGIGGFVVYACRSPIRLHEFDTAWYHAPRGVTEALGRSFRAQHRLWYFARKPITSFIRLAPAASLSSWALPLPMIPATFSSISAQSSFRRIPLCIYFRFTAGQRERSDYFGRAYKIIRPEHNATI